MNVNEIVLRYPFYNNYKRDVNTHKSKTINFNKTAEAATQFPLHHKNVYFQGYVVFNNNEFETTYTKNFFKKILNEGVPCAYTGVDLISQKDISTALNSNFFNKKASVVIPYLKKYKDQMFDVERQVFTILEKEAKKNPDLNLQELLRKKYKPAEKVLINQQSAILNKINFISRGLNHKDYLIVRNFINKSFDKIFEPNEIPERRFKRQEFIGRLSGMKLGNAKIHKRMLEEAEKLPQSSTSVQAFIVKYSQLYKFKCIGYQTYQKVTRNSEEIALRLIKPSFATDDHIYPQERYKMEEIARQNGDEEAFKLSDLKVTILTSDYINRMKGNILVDDFIQQCPFDVKTNVQKHVDRLIEICKKWENEEKIDDAQKLANYIILLKEEFQRRSNIIDINIEEIEKGLSVLRSKHQKYNRGKKVHTRIKSCGRANNSHSEVYIDNNNHQMENRKLHKHSSRFNK